MLPVCAALAVTGLMSAGPPVATAPPLFVESASAAGLDFVHVNGATGEYYIAEQMGAGAALIDYDADGDLDVFLVQGGPLGSERGQTGVRPGSDRGQTPPAGHPSSRLFRNDVDASGRLRFTDVTDRAGVGLRAYGMGAAVADYNGDGHADLLVTTFGKETLYRNNGNGTFSDVTAEASIGDDLWSTSASFLDYDRDGHLDLFVANYLDFTIAT
ncbi:MAG TPA: VCBS repeat-containing protein, partial [Vicinamibacterales bacterium]|nr:VCBS repeat-containing protein [Vicinamibacterales bacterium]